MLSERRARYLAREVKQFGGAELPYYIYLSALDTSLESTRQTASLALGLMRQAFLTITTQDVIRVLEMRGRVPEEVELLFRVTR